MLLFNIDKRMLEADTGNGGSSESSTDTGSGAGNTELTLESVMSGAAQNGTQNETSSETGNKETESEEQPAEQPAWMQQLPKEMRTDDLGNFKQISDLVKSYKELAEKAGQQSQAPGEDAKPEEIQAFYEKLGKPKTAEDYTIKSIEGDEAGEKLFRDMAFKANLTDRQANDVFTAFNNIAKQEIENRQTAAIKQREDTEKALHDKYGTKYQEKLTVMQNGMRNFTTPEFIGKLNERGLLFDQNVVEMFIALGEASSEAGSTQNGQAGKTYKSIEEGGMFKFKE